MLHPPPLIVLAAFSPIKPQNSHGASTFALQQVSTVRVSGWRGWGVVCGQDDEEGCASEKITLAEAKSAKKTL